ncbi:hypothetical Protein YC6258_00530 [Gynuella sunshinyii YC6258]|uniref:Uncharacterized protein n=1 Tax=Gynuella sunshinyii YC6258 TaxID=1445510 RepID=A0A0C5UZ19_9GAMM|nr:hypothetical Protein YC6258_00530 [Gynuella sunshinyii YC6258]
MAGSKNSIVFAHYGYFFFTLADNDYNGTSEMLSTEQVCF